MGMNDLPWEHCESGYVWFLTQDERGESKSFTRVEYMGNNEWLATVRVYIEGRRYEGTGPRRMSLDLAKNDAAEMLFGLRRIGPAE